MKKITEMMIAQGETSVICETCGETFLKVNTRTYMKKSQCLKGRPDKWVVLALEHKFYNLDHMIGYYQNGVKIDRGMYDLHKQLEKTNAEEIERFKKKTEDLPF